MKKCTIISYIDKNPDILLKSIDTNAYILCADIGLSYALESGIIPDLLIGDLDSFLDEVPPSIAAMKVPREKDDTDTGLCIRYAIDQGFDTIEILGGMGGRLDHTLANLQSMKGAKDAGVNISMRDLDHEVHILKNEKRYFKRREGYLSVFAAELSTGVYEKGTKYELTHATLTTDFPLGVSNEFLEEDAMIEVQSGTLYVVFSK